MTESGDVTLRTGAQVPEVMAKGDNMNASAAVRVYEKTSSGITTRIPLEEGQWILNHYSGAGNIFVKSLTRTASGAYEIVLKRGEKIRLVELDYTADVVETA